MIPPDGYDAVLTWRKYSPAPPGSSLISMW